LQEFAGDKKPGIILHMEYICTYITCVTYIKYILLSTHANFVQPGWRGANQPLSMSVKCSLKFSQVLYAIPITLVLDRIPAVPAGETELIPSLSKEGNTFPGATCDKQKDSADDCRWWYIWALKWATS
jgi:hypothetical protein